MNITHAKTDDTPGAAEALRDAIEWIEQTAPTVAARALEIYETAEGFITSSPAASSALIAGGVLLAMEHMFGPVVRENEVALFRSRLTERLTPLAAGQYGLHRRIFTKEERDLAGAALNDVDGACAFQPSSLVNERGRLSLAVFIYEFRDEEVQTSDGAVVRASGSVSFRLDVRHIHAFFNYAMGSFAQSFRQRVRSAIYNEIGRQRRDAVIGHQTASCQRVEDELIRASEGAPGADEESGLGILIERVNLLVSPDEAEHEEGPAKTRSGNGPLVTIDSIRWLNEMIKQEEVAENRQFLREAFGSYMEASRTIEVARQLGASGNLIIATPDDAGLTKGAAAAAHLQMKDGRPDLRLIAPSAPESA